MPLNTLAAKASRSLARKRALRDNNEETLAAKASRSLARKRALRDNNEEGIASDAFEYARR